MTDNKLLDVATQILVADITNGNRTSFIFEWSDSNMQRMTMASVKMSQMLLDATEKTNKVK